MIYLNHAGHAPTRREAVRAYDETLNEFNALLFSPAGVQWYRAKLSECRERVARLLQVDDADTVVFTGGATVACRLLMASMPVREHGTVITTDHEHPGILRALSGVSKAAEQQTLIRCDARDALLSEVERAFHARPRLALISHVSYVDGRVLPIQEIGDLARRTGVPLVVDGAQAAGHIDVRLAELGCDAYFFSGHKWCGGPMGTGALIVNDSWFRKLAGLSSGLDRARPVWEMFEGTMNVALIAGFAEACTLRTKETDTTGRLGAVRERFERELRQIPGLVFAGWKGPQAPGILSFGVEHRDPGGLVDYLAARDIAVKPFPPLAEPASLIRISWSAEMNEENVTHTARTIAAWMSRSE
jgi:selenocysteine lyase/cysteine desulfurase